MSLRVFPIADVPGVHFTDDFNAPRGISFSPAGTPDAPRGAALLFEGQRAHAGNDLFAPEGSPVLAVDDGAVRFVKEGLGGLSFYLKADDGVTYFGTHMSEVEGSARRVQAGEVIGYVGHGGNAKGTPDHLHFEMHPPGVGAVDPFPFLRTAERRDAPSRGAGSTLLLLGLVGGLGYGLYRLYGNPVSHVPALARLLR